MYNKIELRAQKTRTIDLDVVELRAQADASMAAL